MKDTFYAPLEIKFAADAEPGTFAGYASVYGVVDDGGDLIAPGAFRTSLAQYKAAGRTVSMYMQHGAILGADPRPVGLWKSLEEDGTGLAGQGKLIGLNTETGRYNEALVKEGAMTGLSVGYRVVKATYGKAPGEPRRTIHEAKLIEVSIVDQPMNAQARITGIKSMGNTERDYERWLMQDAGLSRREARVVLNHGFKALLAMQDAGDEGADELAQLAQSLRNATKAIAA